MKDLSGNTIYICPQCKDGNFKTIKDEAELSSARSNYLIKEKERKEKEEEQNKFRKEFQEERKKHIQKSPFRKDKI